MDEPKIIFQAFSVDSEGKSEPVGFDSFTYEIKRPEDFTPMPAPKWEVTQGSMLTCVTCGAIYNCPSGIVDRDWLGRHVGHTLRFTVAPR